MLMPLRSHFQIIRQVFSDLDYQLKPRITTLAESIRTIKNYSRCSLNTHFRKMSLSQIDSLELTCSFASLSSANSSKFIHFFGFPRASPFNSFFFFLHFKFVSPGSEDSDESEEDEQNLKRCIFYVATTERFPSRVLRPY